MFVFSGISGTVSFCSGSFSAFDSLTFSFLTATSFSLFSFLAAASFSLFSLFFLFGSWK